MFVDVYSGWFTVTRKKSTNEIGWRFREHAGVIESEFQETERGNKMYAERQRFHESNLSLQNVLNRTEVPELRGEEARDFKLIADIDVLGEVSGTRYTGRSVQIRAIDEHFVKLLRVDNDLASHIVLLHSITGRHGF